MDMEETQRKILYYDGKAYRVIDASPSGQYELAQDAAFLGLGEYGAFVDMPIVLFRVGDGGPEYVGNAVFPFDALDGPWLDSILWREEEGFVRLRFCAVELAEVRDCRILFQRGR